MATTKKKKLSKSTTSTTATTGAATQPTTEPVHTEATTTMLSFANPPARSDPQSVATGCSRQGFTTIGINIVSDDQIIDFSLIDPSMCADLASAIELCVDTKGFFIPALTGTLQVLNQKKAQITFGNFCKASAQLIKPKADVIS
jgi:hypothetical protein